MKDELLIEAEAMRDELESWYRALHQIPELGMHLPKTADYIEGELKKLGVVPKRWEGSSLLTAVIGEGEGVLALRADTDALPIREESGLPFASTNGNMHACGHDAHAAMLLGAVKLLLGRKLSVRIKLIFQPAEETGNGVKPLIEGGLFEDPKPEAALAQHVGRLTEEADVGQIGVRSGPMMASYDRFTVRIVGKSAHGAMPWRGVDPITASAHVLCALESILSRENDETSPVVLTVGQIAGGSAPNVIPDEVCFSGTVRTLSREKRDLVERRFREIVTHTAEAFRCAADIEYLRTCPALQNDADIVRLVKKAAGAVLGEDGVAEMVRPVLVAEDFAYYAEAMPAALYFLPSGRAGSPANHNARFTVDSSVLPSGAALLARAALLWAEERAGR